MATLTSGISAHQYGIETDETSIIVKRFDVETAPQFIAMQVDKVNNALGRAVGALMQNIELEGELSATSAGVLAFVFTTACTLANDKDYHGQTTGDVFLERSRIGQTYNGFKNISQSLTRHAGVSA